MSKEKTKKTTESPKEKNKSADSFAVIRMKNEQYKVEEGKTYEFKKLDAKPGDKIKAEEVLLVSNEKDTKIGQPTLKDAEVELEIVEQKKGKKVRTFKYKAKARYRRTYGKRPLLTVVKVNKIKA
jgi:large subunit ribosomal protein L21